jgi:transposase
MSDSIYWVGLDVHADKVNAAVLRSDDSAPLEQWELVPDDRGLGRLAKRLKGYPGQVRCVYEAGPCGYELARHLRSREISCEVTAPGLIPKKPGDRVKTDRRDAFKLAHLYRAGELTMVAIPGPEQESLRDLLRAREDAKDDLLRRRHRLSKFLLRHGYRYRGGVAWTLGHWAWIRSIHFEDPRAQLVLDGYVTSVVEQSDRVKNFDPIIEEAARDPRYARAVVGLAVLRGVAVTAALTILSEVGDLRRFRSAPAFMNATGLVPGEHSSGASRRQGAITKTGNAHLRRVLVEAAWQYRHRPSLGRAIRSRRDGQPPALLTIARHADQRLTRKYLRLIFRGKRSTQATVAVARELAGFIWDIGQNL